MMEQTTIALRRPDRRAKLSTASAPSAVVRECTVSKDSTSGAVIAVSTGW